MEIDIKKSYNIQIWLGLKNIQTNEIKPLLDVENFIQKYCDKIGSCLTITPTKFIYTKGNEDGVIIGSINYPRFPKEQVDHETQMINLAKDLMIEMNQCRVSITTPERTFMLSNTEIINQLENVRK